MRKATSNRLRRSGKACKRGRKRKATYEQDSNEYAIKRRQTSPEMQLVITAFPNRPLLAVDALARTSGYECTVYACMILFAFVETANELVLLSQCLDLYTQTLTR